MSYPLLSFFLVDILPILPVELPEWGAQAWRTSLCCSLIIFTAWVFPPGNSPRWGGWGGGKGKIPQRSRYFPWILYIQVIWYASSSSFLCNTALNIMQERENQSDLCLLFKSYKQSRLVRSETRSSYLLVLYYQRRSVKFGRHEKERKCQKKSREILVERGNVTRSVHKRWSKDYTLDVI